jgi:hypothetical protein
MKKKSCCGRLRSAVNDNFRVLYRSLIKIPIAVRTAVEKLIISLTTTHPGDASAGSETGKESCF